MNDEHVNQNLERLLQAATGGEARPDPALRRQTLQRLSAELKAAQTSAATTDSRAAPPVRSTARVNFDEPANAWARRAETNTQTTISQRMETIMKRLFTGWGFGLTAAATAGVVLLLVIGSAPKAQAKALAIMSKGVKAIAKLTTVHLQGQVRTTPNDNFSAIMPGQEFVSIELWKQFSPELKWRVDKPGRVAAMNGQSTILFLKPDYAVKAGPSREAFDTQWLHEMADLSETLIHELSAIKAHGWPVSLTEAQGDDGKPKSVITVQAKANVPDSDYLNNKFFMTADTRRVYVFDNETERLEGVKVYLPTPAGESLVFELTRIDYNQPIDPSVFELQLPANVKWDQGLKAVPDEVQYTALTADQAARAFFEACGREDWPEAEKFCTFANSDSFHQYLGGITIVSLGQSSGPAWNGAYFIPYEIKLKDGMVKKHKLALKRNPTTNRWFVDGGI